MRQGGKLSDALTRDAERCRRWRCARCGSARKPDNCRCSPGAIADYYEAKLQRSLDRLVGVVGPAAIIVISLIVGGLIVSVMTALLSVNQIAQ